MCILGQLKDVEIFKAICKKKKKKKSSRVISLSKTVYVYIWWPHFVFKDRSSFVVLCNMEAFVREEGPHAE